MAGSESDQCITHIAIGEHWPYVPDTLHSHCCQGWGRAPACTEGALGRTQVPVLLALRPGEQVEGLLDGGAPQGQQVADAVQLGALLRGRPPAAVVGALQNHGRHALRNHPELYGR